MDRRRCVAGHSWVWELCDLVLGPDVSMPAESVAWRDRRIVCERCGQHATCVDQLPGRLFSLAEAYVWEHVAGAPGEHGQTAARIAALQPGWNDAVESCRCLRCWWWGPLTDREAEMARGIVAGAGRRAISEVLGVSPRTFDTHRSNLLRKLGALNEVQLLRLALQKGWVALCAVMVLWGAGCVTQSDCGPPPPPPALSRPAVLDRSAHVVVIDASDWTALGQWKTDLELWAECTAVRQ